MDVLQSGAVEVLLLRALGQPAVSASLDAGCSEDGGSLAGGSGARGSAIQCNAHRLVLLRRVMQRSVVVAVS